MKARICFLGIFFLTLFSLNSSAQENNWTHFRGSDLRAVASGTDYPVSWSDSNNIAWVTDIRGRGWSSPLVFGQQIWLSSATADGTEMFAVCLDRKSGEILFDIPLFTPEKVFSKHAVNSYATPTGAIEDGYVYFHFGRYGTVCLDAETGKKIWERTDMQCEHVQGPGSSLLLHKDKLFVHMEGTDVQDIYALDKKTGKTIWKVSRDPAFYDKILEIGKKAYVTPIVMTVAGREILITNGSAVCNAFDVETGELVWYIHQGEDSTISMPLEYKGRVYFYTSFVTPEAGDKYCELWSVDPRGRGDLSGNILWRVKFPILQLLTPVIKDGLLYTVDSESMLWCLDAESGETVWKEKLKGKYNSSPVWAGGNIYVSDTRGSTLVFKAGKSFDKISENHLPGEIWATPAFVDGNIFIRTSKGIYKIVRVDTQP